MSDSRDINVFYIYRWIRLDQNVPFYVGKGTKDRAYQKNKSRNTYFKNIINSVPTEVEIVLGNLTETEAFKKEAEFINLYKKMGYCEANFSNGGEGSSGYHHTKEALKKMSIAKKGMVSSKKGKTYEEIYGEEKANLLLKEMSKNAKKRPLHKALIDNQKGKKGGSNPNYGKTLPQEQKDKISNSLKGRKISTETLKKLSLAHKGKKKTKKHCENISKGLKGIKKSKEHCENLSKALKGKIATNKGKKLSKEECIKNAIAHGGAPFLVFDKNSNFIGEWINKTDCARELKIDRHAISKCLKNPNKIHRKFIFKYKDVI